MRSEVRHCDLVGYRPGSDEPLIVEMKKTFNLPLLLQGLERQKLSGEVYLAVEKNRAKKGPTTSAGAKSPYCAAGSGWA